MKTNYTTYTTQPNNTYEKPGERGTIQYTTVSYNMHENTSELVGDSGIGIIDSIEYNDASVAEGSVIYAAPNGELWVTGSALNNQVVRLVNLSTGSNVTPTLAQAESVSWETGLPANSACGLYINGSLYATFIGQEE